MQTKPLDIELIKQHIEHQDINNVWLFDSLDSTNAWLLKNGFCGDVCLAEQQTAGRGRRGRIWHSPQQGNLYLSLKYCFNEMPKHYGLLSLLVGVVIAKCLQKEGLQGHGLKWPNDILWQGKKLGGVLLESKGNLKEIVIGIGLNVAMQEQKEIDQPWISLNQVLGCEVDRNRLVGRLLSALLTRLQHFSELNFDEFVQEWSTWNLLENQLITVLENNRKVTGRFAGIDQQGLLKLCTDNGNIQKFSAADVSIRAMN